MSLPVSNVSNISIPNLPSTNTINTNSTPIQPSINSITPIQSETSSTSYMYWGIAFIVIVLIGYFAVEHTPLKGMLGIATTDTDDTNNQDQSQSSTPPGSTPPGSTPPGSTPPGSTPPGSTPPGSTSTSGGTSPGGTSTSGGTGISPPPAGNTRPGLIYSIDPNDWITWTSGNSFSTPQQDCNVHTKLTPCNRNTEGQLLKNDQGVYIGYVSKDCAKCGYGDWVCANVPSDGYYQIDGKDIPAGDWCLPSGRIENVSRKFKVGNEIYSLAKGEHVRGCEWKWNDNPGACDCDKLPRETYNSKKLEIVHEGDYGRDIQVTYWNGYDYEKTRTCGFLPVNKDGIMLLDGRNPLAPEEKCDYTNRCTDCEFKFVDPKTGQEIEKSIRKEWINISTNPNIRQWILKTFTYPKGNCEDTDYESKQPKNVNIVITKEATPGGKPCQLVKVETAQTWRDGTRINPGGFSPTIDPALYQSQHPSILAKAGNQSILYDYSQCAPVNCGISDWKTTTECTSCDSNKVQTRSIILPKFGGRECTTEELSRPLDDFTRTLSCLTDPACKEDCVYGWKNVANQNCSDCSWNGLDYVPTIEEEKYIVKEARGSGTPCDNPKKCPNCGSLGAYYQNTDKCPNCNTPVGSFERRTKTCPVCAPIDCKYQDGQTIQTCDCNAIPRTETQIILRTRIPGRYGGKDDCSESSTRVETCDYKCPEDCYIGDWTDKNPNVCSCNSNDTTNPTFTKVQVGKEIGPFNGGKVCTPDMPRERTVPCDFSTMSCPNKEQFIFSEYQPDVKEITSMIPTNASKMLIQLWGAGGCSTPAYGPGTLSRAGGGGYSAITINHNSNYRYFIFVGKGGKMETNTSSVLRGGNYINSQNMKGGAGGDGSLFAIYDGNVYQILAIAGGGGGGIGMVNGGYGGAGGQDASPGGQAGKDGIGASNGAIAGGNCSVIVSDLKNVGGFGGEWTQFDSTIGFLPASGGGGYGGGSTGVLAQYPRNGGGGGNYAASHIMKTDVITSISITTSNNTWITYITPVGDGTIQIDETENYMVIYEYFIINTNRIDKQDPRFIFVPPKTYTLSELAAALTAELQKQGKDYLSFTWNTDSPNRFVFKSSNQFRYPYYDTHGMIGKMGFTNEQLVIPHEYGYGNFVKLPQRVIAVNEPQQPNLLNSNVYVTFRIPPGTYTPQSIASAMTQGYLNSSPSISLNVTWNDRTKQFEYTKTPLRTGDPGLFQIVDSYGLNTNTLKTVVGFPVKNNINPQYTDYTFSSTNINLSTNILAAVLNRQTLPGNREIPGNEEHPFRRQYNFGKGGDPKENGGIGTNGGIVITCLLQSQNCYIGDWKDQDPNACSCDAVPRPTTKVQVGKEIGPFLGGAPCTGNEPKTRSVACSYNTCGCKVSDWSECKIIDTTNQCGPGSQTRSVIYSDQTGTNPCPPLTQNCTKPCVSYNITSSYNTLILKIIDVVFDLTDNPAYIAVSRADSWGGGSYISPNKSLRDILDEINRDLHSKLNQPNFYSLFNWDKNTNTLTNAKDWILYNSGYSVIRSNTGGNIPIKIQERIVQIIVPIGVYSPSSLTTFIQNQLTAQNTGINISYNPNTYQFSFSKPSLTGTFASERRSSGMAWTPPIETYPEFRQNFSFLSSSGTGTGSRTSTLQNILGVLEFGTVKNSFTSGTSIYAGTRTLGLSSGTGVV